MRLDPSRVPVVVGVGHAIERDATVAPVDIAARAALTAFDEAPRVARRIERLAMIAPSFSPGGSAPERALAERVGLAEVPCEAVAPSGNSPQTTVTRLAAEIAAGRLGAALIAGGEAVRSSRATAEAPVRLFETDTPASRRPPASWAGRAALPGMAIGLLQPVAAFAVLENAMAHSEGHAVEERRSAIGKLYARFTEAASRHPFAWFRDVLTPGDIAGVTASNRLIAEPYTKRMTAFPYVDQGAALVLCSLEVARAAGCADRCVFVWSGADAGEAGTPVAWPDLARPRANGVATGRALEAAGIGVDDIALLDLYSCFPSAVHMAVDGLRLDPDDARGLTVIGGLAYFGGPGANYSTHAIATVVERLRQSPGLGMVAATGSVMSMKHGAGVYGSEPPPDGFRVGDTSGEQAEILAAAVPVADDAEGTATVEGATVVYDDAGRVTGAPAIARLPDGRRVAVAADPSILDQLAGVNLVGSRISVSGTYQL